MAEQGERKGLGAVLARTSHLDFCELKSHLPLVNERVLNRLHQVQRITRRLQQERRFLMRVLDSYGDDYRAGQFTIVLEDEGSQGTDAPTPGNAENEPPEKEGLTPPRRTPAVPESSSPVAGEGPSGRKRRRAPRDGRRGTGSTLTPVQV
ncbi:TCF3 fusion partner, partial [Echinops telfairi]|uniref:TCF3 fusion partner n=1 Tax=Echinops telfairi TaxID=9371 RepID=A0ABM0ZTI2_ECHTE